MFLFKVSVTAGRGRPSLFCDCVHKLLHRSYEPVVSSLRPLLDHMLLHRLYCEQSGCVLCLPNAYTKCGPSVRHHSTHSEQDVLYVPLSETYRHIWLFSLACHQVARAFSQSTQVRQCQSASKFVSNVWSKSFGIS